MTKLINKKVGALTGRQRQVLDFVTQYIARHGMPPTKSEIAVGMGFCSTNAAVEHLRALEKKGFIEIRTGVSRGIMPVAKREISLPSTSNEDYWFDGTFQHRRYERDICKAVEAMGLKVLGVDHES